jgi:hypothetical protein
LRTVLAKNGEMTRSTAADRHLGQAGRERRPECAAIGSVRAKRALQAVQRYS